ncbi:serine hydrolase domain-containing protein [Roseicella aerolata]|uniref:Beta-lactamase family protein n=1 Tax=Roseicella aerolata TaxID=2883479 RepID=A0A9X1L7D2_9PROT|nr:serine hydrolase [Roseicella aerolata]MCB4821831.1 beta-lactamase family protein [Roseicella aerolata]
MAARQADPMAHLPRAGDFLLYPPTIQPWGYRIVDRLFAHRVVRRGRPKPWARGAEIAPAYLADGRAQDVEAFMERNFLAGLLVVQDGRIRLERYGLGLAEGDRWTTMSTIKSWTAILLGAAIRDGAIESVEAPVTRFLPELAGTAYAGVTLRDLLTMSSGTRWTEVYSDPDCDVNRYSRALAAKEPGGVLRIMAGLPRATLPGSAFLYNSGDTFLLGAALTRAVGRPLADYLSERIWQPAGMEFDAFYTLESEGGQEIAGSRAGMALRDMGKLAQFVLDDGVIDGRRVLPEGWIEAVAAPRFAVAEPKPPGITHYGYSWWLGDGLMSAIGFAGQRIDILRAERLAVITLGAFPQPPHVPPERDPAHRREVVSFVQAVRHLLGGPAPAGL